MHRRNFLKLIIGGIAGLSAASLGCPWSVTAQVGLRIWLGPFQWRERISSKTGLPAPAGLFGWRMPVGAIQAFDIRGPQGTPGPDALSPSALFITPGDVVLSAPYVQIASDPLETLTSSARADLIAAFGRTGNGSRFIDLLHDLMTTHTDLSKTNFCPPRVANHFGKIEWKVAGQLVKSVEVGPSAPEWSGVVARHQATYRELRQSGVRDLHSKYLATLMSKYKISESRAVEDFIPADLPKESPIRPSTTLTESFPGTSATLGGDQTWTEITGTWSNVSGVGSKDSTGGTDFARCESTLSTDDMRAQVEQTQEASSSNNFGGPMLRFAAAANTGYLSQASPGLNDWYCTRYSAGSGTDIIISELGGSISVPALIAGEADGDQMEIFEGVNSRGSTTDTNISGNVRGGIAWYYSGSSPVVRFDNWQTEDLAAPPVATPRRSAVIF